MNTLAFVIFLLVKIFPTLIRQNFPPLKFCAIQYLTMGPPAVTICQQNLDIFISLCTDLGLPLVSNKLGGLQHHYRF